MLRICQVAQVSIKLLDLDTFFYVPCFLEESPESFAKTAVFAICAIRSLQSRFHLLGQGNCAPDRFAGVAVVDRNERKVKVQILGQEGSRRAITDVAQKLQQSAVHFYCLVKLVRSASVHSIKVLELTIN